uniref:Fibrinogen C-terminal domain-containing protein n=1 Tax=Rhodnius prolixus TaxID=13249 RepID=T1HD12_RHOPR
MSDTRCPLKCGTFYLIVKALYENEVEPTEKRTRHQRYLRKRLDSLETRVILLEEEGRSVGTRLTDMNDKLGLLEGINTTSVDKVHASMLELLESVEALETKVDTNLPTVQKEISRTELNLGQLMQQSAVMKEEQENQKLSVKALGEGISALQQKISGNHGNPASSFYNITSGHNQKKELCSANDVVNQLKTVIQQYDSIVTSLPTACPVNGQSETIEMLNLAGKPRMAVCDKGWTLVQRRKDGTVQFNKDWEDYAVGFGTPQGEFWLGNEALHSLTNANASRLRVDMIDIYGRLWIAEYQNFRVGDRSNGFKLEVSGYSGNASDALDYQNGMQFSARDSDRDISNTHCAANYEGGWWFSHCQHANLNGRYNLGLTWFHASKNEWIAVAESTMKLWTH